MSILAVQNLMQWEKLLEKARRVWFNRKWKQGVVLKGARRDGGGTGSIPVACLTSDDLERAEPRMRSVPMFAKCLTLCRTVNRKGLI